MSDQIAVYIGHKAETVKAASETILKILEARADQKTIRAALTALGKGLAIEGLTFRDVTITQHPPTPDKAFGGTTEGSDE